MYRLLSVRNCHTHLGQVIDVFVVVISQIPFANAVCLRQAVSTSLEKKQAWISWVRAQHTYNQEHVSLGFIPCILDSSEALQRISTNEHMVS